jgi:hypothetical protein
VERAKNVSKKNRLFLLKLLRHTPGEGGGQQKYSFTYSLSSALDEGEWSVSCPDRFTSRESPRYFVKYFSGTMKIQQILSTNLLWLLRYLYAVNISNSLHQTCELQRRPFDACVCVIMRASCKIPCKVGTDSYICVATNHAVCSRRP